MAFPNTHSTRVTTASLLCSERRFPAPTLPLVHKWKDMIGTAFSLAIVSYVINLAMGRTLAAKHGYDVDPNQVTLGLGGHRQGALRREGKSSLQEWEAFKRAPLNAAVLLPCMQARVAACHGGGKGHGRSISCALERACKGKEASG